MLSEQHRIALIEDEQALYGPFFGQLGVTFAMVFAACGAAYATAKVIVLTDKISSPKIEINSHKNCIN